MIYKAEDTLKLCKEVVRRYNPSVIIMFTNLLSIIAPTKSDSHVIFCLQLLSIQYNATHKILT